MPAAPLPSNEQHRLEVLRSLRVLDTQPERGFEDLTALASELLGMPIALVSLVDEHRQWFKSRVGLDVCETPRSQSVCAHAILQREPLVIEDLAADDRTNDNPLVTAEGGLRFYAGVPIRIAGGIAVGSLCVLDRRPRRLSADQLATLSRLASICAAQLESRARAESTHRAIHDASPVALLQLAPVRDSRTRIADFRVGDANGTASKLFRIPRSRLIGVSLRSGPSQLSDHVSPELFRWLRHAATSSDPVSIECENGSGGEPAALRWKAATLRGELVVSIEDISETRTQQREIEARDSLLRQFVKYSPAALAMLDNDMRYLVASDGWRSDYGLGDTELEGRSHYEIFPEIGEEWKALHRRALAGEVLSCDRDRFERADGAVQHLRWHLQPWRDATGAIGGLIMLTEDITERVARESEIERQRELMDMAGRLSQVGGWSFDVEQQKLRWTDETRRIFGVPDDYEPSVERAIAFYKERDADRIAEVFRRALEGGEPYDIELEIETADGRSRLTRSIGKPIVRDGRVVRVSGSVQDVTEEHRAREETLRAKELLEQSERVSKTGGWAYDIEAQSLYWTPQVHAMHEVAPGFVPDAARALDFYTDASRPIIARAFEDAVELGEPFDLELEIVTARGIVRPVRAVGQPVVEEGRIVRVSGSFQDLTDLRERQAEERRLMGLISAITDASSDVIFVKDAEGRLLFGNPAYAEAIGRPIDELTDLCEYDFFDERSTVDRLRETDIEVMRTGRPMRIEERVKLPATGQRCIFSTEKHPYRLPDGTIGGVIGVGRDITELRAAIEEARVSGARLNLALSAANVGYWDHDLANDTVFYADTWYTMLGYEPGELPMTADCFWETLVHPDDREVARRAQDACLRGETERSDAVIRLRNKSGAWQWIRDIGGVIERDAEGNPTRIVGVHVDVDESKRSQDRLETALVAANEGLWEWDLRTNECLFDEQWYRILGYEPGEMPMTFETWESLCHPDDLGDAKQQLGDYLEGNAPIYAAEHRLWMKEGRWKWILGTCRITERDEHGRPMRVVGVNLDIDERHHAAERLETALEEAKSANAAKSQFLANMSHEIRTPMTAILGYAELMAGDEELASDLSRLRQTAGVIQRNGEHLLAIINDILDFSKIDAGKMTVEAVPTNPQTLFADVEELLRGRAIDKGLRFEVQQRAALPEAIVADPVRIRQVLMNIIQNAIKFTESGAITVRVDAAPAEDAQPDADPTRLRISVSDTGIGISHEKLATLFTVFNQGDDSMARRFGGTGLGLAISKHLAELMGGRLTATSREGRGSTFTLELPLVPVEDARWIEPGMAAPATRRAAAPERAETDGGIAGARILLVEDGPDNQRLISHHLKKAGAVVTLAGDGADGVKAFEDAQSGGEPFDVVLMDMQMPVMDGYTATRTLRERGVGTPIVALTAHAMSGDRQRCLDAGCDDYETKPVDRRRLIEICAQHLRRARRAA